MRKNHHGKKDRLVKRVFALCLALAVICTCLVPVFATEASSSLQVNQEASRPVEDGEATYPDGNEAAYPEDEAAGFGEDFPAVEDGEAAGFGDEPREVYDDSETTGFGEEEASRPVEGGEDNLEGGPNVKETEWGTVIEYDTSTSTDPSSSTVTQWSGEDDVVAKPDDKVVVSGDEIKKLQDMVVYRFWLKELNTLDLQDIAAKAQNDNMTESEYLARNGEVLWGLYFIQAVPRTETIADYSSYIENPSSNRDPKGELRLFDYWYTLDEFGNRVRLNLSDPTSNILDSKTTTVNVYAAWKDGTVGSDEEEKVDHEDLVDKNPVPVTLDATAAATYEGDDDKTESVDLPVEVKNLPSAAHSLSVSHMGDKSMTEFCNTYKSELQGMQPLLGLKISPKNAKGETVQPANGQKATVTVSGLNELPDIAEMEEMGALTADALKVLHLKDNGTVEKLDVLTYTNGTLTFETSSFSPFVLALEYPDQGSEDFDDDGIEIVSIEIDGVEYPNVNDGISTIASSIQGDTKVPVGATITLRSKNGKSNYYHNWRIIEGENCAEFVGATNGKGDTYKTVKLKLTSCGKVKVRHDYGKNKDKLSNNDTSDTIEVVDTKTNSSFSLYVYTQIRDYSQSQGDYYQPHVENKAWNGMAVGTILNVDDPVKYKGKVRPENQLYDTSNTENKLGTEILVDSGQFPVIPIKQADGSYKDYYYLEKPSSWEQDAQKNYGGTYTIKWYEVVATGGANTGKNGSQGDWKDEKELEQQYKSQYTNGVYQSPITPVKYETMTYHLDGLLLIHDATHINVQFMVQDAGKNTFDLVNDYGGAFTVQSTGGSISLSNIDRPDVPRAGQTQAEYPQTKPTADGTIYKFDGWYTNKNCTPDSKFNFDDDTIKEDTTFYAKYVPASANLTVTKTVTGMLGDTNKAFTFQIVDGEGNAVELTNNNCEFNNTNGALLNGTDGKFMLKHGDTVTIKNLVPGTYKIEEIGDDLTSYETSWQVTANGVTGSANVNQRVATVTMSGTNVTLDFTNHCKLFPDTGVLLDTLPYIVILAVVAGGVALLMLRKRRKEDD